MEPLKTSSIHFFNLSLKFIFIIKFEEMIAANNVLESSNLELINARSTISELDLKV